MPAASVLTKRQAVAVHRGGTRDSAAATSACVGAGSTGCESEGEPAVAGSAAAMDDGTTTGTAGGATHAVASHVSTHDVPSGRVIVSVDIDHASTTQRS